MIKLNMTDNSTFEHAESVLSRRDALKKTGAGFAALTLAGVGLAATARPAQAQLASANAGLDLAIRTALLQRDFYNAVQNDAAYSVNFSAVEQGIIELIHTHKVGHVTALTAARGSGAPTAATYDFSGNGAWGTALLPTSVSDYNDFFEMAQLLEDFGVRVQKAAIAQMVGHASLQTVFRIHSASGTHAGMIRMLRGEATFLGTTAWIFGKNDENDASFGNYTGSGIGSQGYLHDLTYGATAADSTTGASTSEDNWIQGAAGTYSTFAAEWYDEPIRITSAVNDADLFLVEFDA